MAARAMPGRSNGMRRTVGARAYILAALLPFLAVVVASLVYVARQDFPYYGVWTGIRPVETKLAMLEDFAKKGDVDALLLGSSIVDFGFSAERFSAAMSRRLGRPYRAFNFATGGSEPRTLPALYRLARMAARPKAVFVSMPPAGHLPEFRPGEPDEALNKAPVGFALQHPWLLPLSKGIYDTRVMQSAPAIRDLLVFGDYRNLQRQVGMEAYYVDGHGDRVTYTFMPKVEELEKQAQSYESSMRLYKPGKLDRAHFYFADVDIAAIDTLRELVERDGGKLYLLSHAGASVLWKGPGFDPTYAAARREFYEVYAERMGARFLDVTDVPYRMPLYCVTDTTHLNAYGAAIYAELAAAAATQGKSETAERLMTRPVEVPDLRSLASADPSMNTWAALIERPAGEAHSLLRFSTVLSIAVPPLPVEEEVYAILKTPQGKEIHALAVRSGTAEYIAEVNLAPAPRAEAYVLTLVLMDPEGRNSLSNPIATYEWIGGFPRSAGDAPIAALPPERRAGDTLYVALRPGTKAASAAQIRLADSAGKRFVDLGAAPRAGDLAKVALPADMPEGKYRVEALAEGAVVARSAAIQVDPHPSHMIPPRIAVARVSRDVLRISWSGIRHTTRGDWIGLFPVAGTRGQRLDVIMVGGRAAGDRDYRIPDSIRDQLARGEYEFRLYANGGWHLLARSDPMTFPRS